MSHPAPSPGGVVFDPAAAGGWQVRAARVADAGQVHQLTRAAFTPQAGLQPVPGALGEGVDDVAADLAAQGGLVAVSGDGQLAGALRWREDPPLRWVRRVAVAPRFSRRGVGRALLGAAAAAATGAGATALRAGVRRELPGNLDFYHGLGFHRVAENPRGLVLGRPLSRPVDHPEELRALGRRLAALLVAGDVLVAAGELGSGKTVLAQGIAAGLGVSDPVTSPTFVLVRQHRGTRLDFLHADVYRLGGAAEIDDLDLDTDLLTAALYVEWGAGLAEQLADGHLRIELHRVDPAPGTEPRGGAAVAPEEGRRWVRLTGHGEAWRERQDRIDREV